VRKKGKGKKKAREIYRTEGEEKKKGETSPFQNLKFKKKRRGKCSLGNNSVLRGGKEKGRGKSLSLSLWPSVREGKKKEKKKDLQVFYKKESPSSDAEKKKKKRNLSPPQDIRKRKERKLPPLKREKGGGHFPIWSKQNEKRNSRRYDRSKGREGPPIAHSRNYPLEMGRGGKKEKKQRKRFHNHRGGGGGGKKHCVRFLPRTLIRGKKEAEARTQFGEKSKKGKKEFILPISRKRERERG